MNCVVSNYICGAFGCLFLSCHVRVWEWFCTVSFPEWEGTSCSKRDGIRTHNHLFRKRKLNHLAKNEWVALWVLIFTANLTVFSDHVTYEFQSESAVYNCLNFKELFSLNRRNIWNLNDSNGIRIDNYLAPERILYSQRDQLIKLCCDYKYIYPQCIWPYVLIMSRTGFRVNLRSLGAWMLWINMFETDAISDVLVTATRFEPTTTWFGNKYSTM